MQTSSALNDILDNFEAHASELLPILHAIQAQHRYVPPSFIPEIARYLSLSNAEVHAVLQFYEDFTDTPLAKHVIRICRAEACQANGGLDLIASAERLLQCKLGEKSADDNFELHASYCLGLCANGPAVQIGTKQFAQITPEALARLIGTIQ